MEFVEDAVLTSGSFKMPLPNLFGALLLILMIPSLPSTTHREERSLKLRCCFAPGSARGLKPEQCFGRAFECSHRAVLSRWSGR